MAESSRCCIGRRVVTHTFSLNPRQQLLLLPHRVHWTGFSPPTRNLFLFGLTPGMLSTSILDESNFGRVQSWNGDGWLNGRNTARVRRRRHMDSVCRHPLHVSSARRVSTFPAFSHDASASCHFAGCGRFPSLTLSPRGPTFSSLSALATLRALKACSACGKLRRGTRRLTAVVFFTYGNRRPFESFSEQANG